MKITARDIFNTASDLKRYANYADRHMYKSTISEVSEKVESAKIVMREAIEEFMETDIATFTADTSDIERDLENRKSYKARLKDEIKTIKNELKNPNDQDTWWDEDSTRENLGWAKDRLKEVKAEIKSLKIDLYS